MTECKVTGWRLIDELVLMKHWKASDDEWGVCLYVFDWIWLQMLYSDIGSSPDADNITNDITSNSEYLHLFWQHGSPATEADIEIKLTNRGMNLQIQGGFIFRRIIKLYEVTTRNDEVSQMLLHQHEW